MSVAVLLGGGCVVAGAVVLVTHKPGNYLQGGGRGACLLQLLWKER